MSQDVTPSCWMLSPSHQRGAPAGTTLPLVALFLGMILAPLVMVEETIGEVTRLDEFVTGQDESQFGNSLAGGGDFNGDGYADFAVAGYDLDSTTGTTTGAVWVYYGPFDTAASFDWDLKIPSPNAGNQNFGWSID